MPDIITITTIDLPAGSTVSPWRVGKQTVAMKDFWSDEWVEVADLACDEAVWCAAPSIPTASLRWHYGRIAAPGQTTFAEVFRRQNPDQLRLYVRIEFLMRPIFDQILGDTWTTRYWYGLLLVDEDHLGGEVYEALLNNRLATGQQAFSCYGFAEILDREFIQRAFWDADDAGHIQEAHRSIVFNPKGRKNRSPYDFDVFHFAKSRETAEYWSSRNIFEYLVHYHTPRDWADVAQLPFEIDWGGMEGAVPDWDHPTIDPENRSLWSLLTTLCPRQRLCSFWLDVVDGDEPDDPEKIVIRPFTFVAEDVETIDGEEPIPANNSQIKILCAYDQSGEQAVKISLLDRYDQVVARGARRRTVFTISESGGTLEAGWTGALQTVYEAGASGVGGYGGLDLTEQRRVNQEARNSLALREVFSRFAIPDDWDGTVLTKSAFPDEDQPFPETSVFPQYWPGLAIEKTLPLLESVDYSGSKIADGTVDEAPFGEFVLPPERGPMVCWLEPDSGLYLHVERLSQDTPLLSSAEDFNWSASVSVEDDDRAIRLNVSGAHQHVLDFPGFTPLSPEDEDVGEHDWRGMVCTVSMQDDRYAEAKYPPDDEIWPHDFLHILWLDAGDEFRVDYVVPATVVEIGSGGNLVTSDGGYLHDDRELLASIARIAYTYYSRERRVLTLATDQLTEEFELGQFVVEINQADATQSLDGGGHFMPIATPITEIRIAVAEGTTKNPPAAARLRLVTDCGQLDSLQLVHPEEPTSLAELRGRIEKSFGEAEALMGKNKSTEAVQQHFMRMLGPRYERK